MKWMRPVWIGALILGAAEPVLGCAVCFGKSDSALAQGMNMGIMSLLVFVVLMWIGIGAFFIYLARRSARVAQSGSGQEKPEMTESVVQ